MSLYMFARLPLQASGGNQLSLQERQHIMFFCSRVLALTHGAASAEDPAMEDVVEPQAKRQRKPTAKAARADASSTETLS